MTAVVAIAGHEVLAGIRNRWMLAASLLLGVLALTLAFIGSTPAGPVAASPLAITVVSLSSLSVFLVPLIGLLVSYDTLVGEIERGTMPLLMTYPVTRWRIVLGKFAGQVAILAIATVVGFGVAALATGLGDGGDAEAWGAFGIMVGGSILLGAAFIALGTLFSAMVAERGTAAGVSAAAWLIFVVLFDMALLAVLVADEGQVVSGELFRVLLLLNPTDVYRMLTLAGSETVGRALRHGGGERGGRLRSCASVPGHGALGRGAARPRWPLVREEGVVRRALALLAIGLLALSGVAGCGEDDNVVAKPPPVEPTREASGHYCGMILVDHTGPKAQVHLPGEPEPVWFSSVRDAIAFTMLPEEPRNYAAIYVNDMGVAQWEAPEPGTWIDAAGASYVIGSDRMGGMGVPEAVPFATREAAERFVAAHGGRIVALTEVPESYIFAYGDDDTVMPTHGDHQ